MSYDGSSGTLNFMFMAPDPLLGITSGLVEFRPDLSDWLWLTMEKNVWHLFSTLQQIKIISKYISHRLSINEDNLKSELDISTSCSKNSSDTNIPTALIVSRWSY